MAIFSACSRKLLTSILNASKVTSRPDIFHTVIRRYAKDDDCRRAIVDIPPKKDPVCPEPCERWSQRKPKFIHKIRMKILEGGSNFGTPFRRVRCEPPDEKSSKKQKASGTTATKATKALPAPEKREPPPVPEPRPGVQVSILGADMPVGQYLALLLKQCPTIKRLRLYEATMPSCDSTRHIGNVAEDLQHIDTNCTVQGFSCTGASQLERCLQNTDIVVMLESGVPNLDMSIEERFLMQAPKVKMYADAIATECPRAFLIVCVAPIDCMVPLVAQTFKETGWYNPKLLLGSMAVPEMRASTLAARALGLEPRYTRVPCIGGTEGEALVPLFSKAIEYFDFSPQNAAMMTEAVRMAPTAISKSDSSRAADLSEAHALAKLVTSVSHALLCHDLPRVSGFVETDSSQVISPARFIANVVEIGRTGIKKSLGLPKLTEYETRLVDAALNEMNVKLKMTKDWYAKSRSSSSRLDAYQLDFFARRGNTTAVEDCAYANI